MKFRAEPKFDHKNRRLCDGVRVSGYWKGYACVAFAKHPIGDRMFCGQHFAIASASQEEKADE